MCSEFDFSEATDAENDSLTDSEDISDIDDGIDNDYADDFFEAKEESEQEALTLDDLPQVADFDNDYADDFFEAKEQEEQESLSLDNLPILDDFDEDNEYHDDTGINLPELLGPAFEGEISSEAESWHEIQPEEMPDITEQPNDFPSYDSPIETICEDDSSDINGNSELEESEIFSEEEIESFINNSSSAEELENLKTLLENEKIRVSDTDESNSDPEKVLKKKI